MGKGKHHRIVLLDGKFVEAGPEVLESLTPGVMSAEGVFETMRAHDGGILLLGRHLQRLSRGLEALGLRWPAARHRIEAEVRRVLRRNHLNEARVRLTVWREGHKTRSAIVCQPIERQYQRGWRAMISPVRHRRALIPPIKSLDYSLFRQAYAQAAQRGFDEAILLNGRGELVEGSRTNIFFVDHNILYTPPIHSGCLNGVARQAVMRCARALRIRCLVRSARPWDLFAADEAFLTNAVGTVIPLLRVGARQIGNGKPGPVTLKLRRAYWDFASKG